MTGKSNIRMATAREPIKPRIVQGIYTKEKLNNITAEQQYPSSQQLVHLMMANYAETCSDMQ
jgi:hypothetical protein